MKTLNLKHYDTLENAIRDASKLEADFKEERSYKARSTSTSILDKNKDNGRQLILMGNERVLVKILKSSMIKIPK